MIWIAILTTALIAVALYYIAQPIISPETPTVLSEPVEDEADLEKLYMTLNELEFDQRTGKLSEEDYQSLSNAYRRSAAVLLRRKEEEMADRPEPIAGSREGVSNSQDERRKRIEIQMEQEIRKEMEKRKLEDP